MRTAEDMAFTHGVSSLARVNVPCEWNQSCACGTAEVAARLAMKASVAAQAAQRHTLVPSSRSTMPPFAVFQPQLLHVRLSFPVICTQRLGDGGARLPRMGE